MASSQRGETDGAKQRLTGHGRFRSRGRVCAALVAIPALAALFGWALDLMVLASFGPNWIPMAPSTAVLFLLSATAVFLRSHDATSSRAYRISLALSGIVLAVALCLAGLAYRGIRLNLEHPGLTIVDTPGAAPLGHMSLITALCFILTALALLTLPPRGAKRRSWRAIAAVWLTASLTAISLILLLAYVYGAPLFVNSRFIPPAAPTSLGFLLLGFAALGLALPHVRTFSPGPETSRLSTHILALTFLVVAVGAITAGLFYNRRHTRQFRQEVERSLAAVADLKVNDLARWRQDRLNHAALLYRNANFTDLVRQAFADPANLEAQERLRHWLEKLKTSRRYDRICLHDAAGSEWMAVPATSTSHANGFDAACAEAMRTAQVRLTDFDRNESDGRVYLRTLVPILDEADGDRPLGVLALRIDPAIDLYPLIQRWPVPSASAETLLIRREGDDILFLNSLRFRPDAALSLRLPANAPDLPAARAAAGHQGILDGIDYRGVPVLACVRAIPDSPWYLVARIDREEVEAPLRQGLWILVGVVVSLLVVAGSVVGQIWRRQSVHYFRERYEAAEALRRQEERYHRTLDTMMEGCQIIGFDWRYLYVNDAVTVHGQQTRDNLVGKTMGECYPGIETTAMFATLKRCMEERTPQRLENDFVYPNGERAWFELSVQPVAEGIFILSLDITARKQAEERLRHLNDVLRAIRNVNQLIVHERNRDALLHRACAILTEARGYRSAWIALRGPDGALRAVAEAGVGDGFAELQAQLERQEWPACYRKVLDGHDTVVMHNTMVNCVRCPLTKAYRDTAALAGALHHGDRHYGILVVALPEGVADNDEEQSLFRELAEDIGFALYGIEMEERHQQAEAKYRTLFEASADAILIADIETKQFRYANPAAARLLGYDETELTGMQVHDIHPKEHLPKMLADFERHAAGATGLLPDVPCLRKDGSIVHADLNAVAIVVDGRPCNAGFYRDTTARKEAVAEQEKLQAQLIQAQKMESIGRLAGGVAHDFNNMLSIILGQSQMMLMKLDANDPRRHPVEEIQHAAKRSANLTRQLLAFARKQTIAPVVLDLNATVEDMLKMLRRLIGEDIDLAWMPDNHLKPVLIDPAQVDQLLANLCLNARDAIDGVGKVTIETANVTCDADFFRKHRDFAPGDYVVLSVSDDGCGMDAATRERVFEPFFTTKAVGEGTGLGLATVFGIVKQNGGFINLYSEPGEGTTFRIYLPAHDSVPTLHRPKPAQVLPARHHEIVLLVEDEPAILDMATEMLGLLGYTVLAAGSPSAAIRIAHEHDGRLDLLITDVVMPEMNGRDLANHLRTTYPALKVLFMSGYTANVIAHRGVLDQGMNFIQKPFSPPELAAKLRDVLGG